MERFELELLIGSDDHAILHYSEPSRGPSRLFVRAWHDGENPEAGADAGVVSRAGLRERDGRG